MFINIHCVSRERNTVMLLMMMITFSMIHQNQATVLGNIRKHKQSSTLLRIRAGGSSPSFSYTKRTYIDWDTTTTKKIIEKHSIPFKKSTGRSRKRHDNNNNNQVLTKNQSKLHTTERNDGENFITESNNDIETSLGPLCEAFRNVLITVEGANDDNNNNNNNIEYDINIPLLLKACYQCEHSMREVGHVSSAKDLYQNTKKVESFLQSIPKEICNTTLMKPLLQYEKNTGIHPYNDKMLLKDPSIAISLLWMRRHVSFQCELFRLLLATVENSNNNNNNNKQNSYPTTTTTTTVETTLLAYDTILKPYHGWALQKISTTAIKLMTPPSFQQVLARIGGFNYTCDNDNTDTMTVPTNDISSTTNLNSKIIVTYSSNDNNNKNNIRRRRGNGNCDTVLQWVSNNKSIRGMYKRIPLRGGSMSTTTLPSSSSSSSSSLTRNFGIAEEIATRRDMKRLVDIWEPLLYQWTKLYLELDLEDYRRV